MLIFIKLILFCLSNLGYYSLLKKKTDLNLCFFPVVTIGIQITVLFFAGILNLLPQVTYLLYLGGIFLFAYEIFRRKGDSFREFFRIPYVFLAVSFLVVILVLSGSKFYDYDDFSHWAMAARSLLQNNRYPNFSDYLIQFKEYPLGSTSYIYYFCKLTGNTESMQMMAQAFMMLAAIVPIFSVMRKNKVFSLIFALLFTNLIFTFLIPVTSLLVDTLLPLFGMSALLLIKSGQTAGSLGETGKQKEAQLFAVPILVSTALIKNSGIFFVLIALVMVLLPMMKNRRVSWKMLLIYMLPFLVLLLWNRHCLLVFTNPETAKHAMTVENYMLQLKDKGLLDILRICFHTVKFMLSHSALLFVLGGAAVLILTIIFADSGRSREFDKEFGAAVCIYGAYILGMCGMYVFSMPLEEARILASIERYTDSAVIALLYFIAVWMVDLISDLNSQKVRILVCCCSLGWVLLTWGFLCGFSVIHGGQGYEVRQELETQVQDYDLPLGSEYFIYGDDPVGYGYIYHMSQYVLQSMEIQVESQISKYDFPNIMKRQYLILLKPAEDILGTWILDNYPDQYGSRVIVLH